MVDCGQKEKQIHGLFKYPNTNPKLTELQWNVLNKKRKNPMSEAPSRRTTLYTVYVYVYTALWCKLHVHGHTSECQARESLC
jgi:hypothetical protein